MTMSEAPSIFESVPFAPPDVILNLTVDYRNDTDPRKVNVGVGAYRTEEEKPWVLPAVKKAERLIVDDPTLDHEYLPISGLASFTAASVELLLGKNSSAIKEQRVVGVQNISGTGSLRLGAEFLERYRKSCTVYLTNPTWGPHYTIFADAGLKVQDYNYYDLKNNTIDFKTICETIQNAPDESIFVLHACAHNPTGMDPTKEQWMTIASEMKKKRHFPFFDSAYQGFASGDPDADAFVVRYFVDCGFELLAAQSYSKNFGLYNERAGCLVAVVKSAQIACHVRSQMDKLTRAIISSPPAFGARIVSMILTTPELRQEWHENLLCMVTRIDSMRKALYAELLKLQTPGQWDHIIKQIGMFCYTGLSEKQSKLLKSKFHIYLTDNGRISMTGITTKNVAYVAEAIDFAVRNKSEL